MIRCTQQHNHKCLKCGRTDTEMINVGAFYMCLVCFNNEFGYISEIDPDSEAGKHYYRWLKVYHNKTK